MLFYSYRIADMLNIPMLNIEQLYKSEGFLKLLDMILNKGGETDKDAKIFWQILYITFRSPRSSGSPQVLSKALGVRITRLCSLERADGTMSPDLS